MVFDSTSTQQASHGHLHLEITSVSFSISFRFDTALTQYRPSLREDCSTVHINNSRKPQMTLLQLWIPQLLDNYWGNTVGHFHQQVQTLKYTFAGLQAAENFPLKIKKISLFFSDKATQIGFHWLSPCNRELPCMNLLSTITPMYVINYFLRFMSGRDYTSSSPIFDSNLLGLCCIYIAHKVFGAVLPQFFTSVSRIFFKHFI